MVGIGINIKKSKETENFSKIAGSIEEAKISQGKKFTPCLKNDLVAEVVKNLIEFYEGFDDENDAKKSEMIEEYRSLSILSEKNVTVNPVAGASKKSYKAKVLGISEEIRLIVETENGEKKELNSGEVSLHSYDFV